MAFNIKDIAKGVRQALYGREVRELIAQMGEWVYNWMNEQMATVKRYFDQMKELKDQASASADASEKSAQNSKASADASASSAKASASSAGDSANSAKASAASAAASATSASHAKDSENSAKRYSENAKDAIATAKSEYSGGYYKTYNLVAPKAGWKTLTPAKGVYGYYCDIPVQDLTDRYSPFCATALESYAVATVAGVATAVETRTGALRLFARNIPTDDIELVLTLFGVGTLSFNLTLPTTEWKRLGTAIGPNQYYCDIEVPGCLSTLTPLATTDLEHFEAAAPAGLASVVQTFDGYVRFYAVRPPEENIDVILALIKKEDPVNKPATRTELGLVMIGDGVDVNSAGTISTRAATDAEFTEMMEALFHGE